MPVGRQIYVSAQNWTYSLTSTISSHIIPNMAKESDLKFGNRVRELQYMIPRRDQLHSDWLLYEGERQLNLVGRILSSMGVHKTPEEVIQILMDEGELRNTVTVYSKSDLPSIWESQDQFADYSKVYDEFLKRIGSFLVNIGVTANPSAIKSNASLISSIGSTGFENDDSGKIEIVKTTNIPGVTAKITLDRDKVDLDANLDLTSITLELSPPIYTATRD